MDIYKKLQEAGLTRNESKVYIELLKKGELSANHVAKNLGIDRTLTYTILNNLIEKGQVNYIIKKNKKIFSTSSPKNLMNPLRTKQRIILDAIKELNKIKHQKQTDISINVYEGKEGIRVLMRLIIKEKHLFSFGGTGRAYDALYEMPAISKLLEKKNFPIKIITTKEGKTHEFTKYKNIQTKFLNINSEATTSIFGDYVSIHMIKNKPVIILIKNKYIAQSYKNHFNYLWKTAKK